MAKVSIGLRGWRFDESEIFTDEGEWKPIEEIPEDPRHRLVRLAILMERPCDACYLIHGEEEKRRCNPAEIVYGEPLEEVVLCSDHEADFLYWFREDGGNDLRGTEEFKDAFHEWFAAGNRAPEGYGGMDHVETDPENLPDLPDAQEIQEQLEEGFEGTRIDFRRGVVEEPDSDATEASEGDDDDDDLSDLDLGADYPTK